MIKQIPKVWAGECPKDSRHQQTQVYKTFGSVRYCKCNDCGSTWKKTASECDDIIPLVEYAKELAKSLTDAERVATDDGNVIVVSEVQAREIAMELERLAAW